METSTLGSEFIALCHARDVIFAPRYKLRMFGPPLEGPAQVYCDNQGVVKNNSIPESILSKKHNAINYHAVHGAAASGVCKCIRKIRQPIWQICSQRYCHLIVIANCWVRFYTIFDLGGSMPKVSNQPLVLVPPAQLWRGRQSRFM